MKALLASLVAAALAVVGFSTAASGHARADSRSKVLLSQRFSRQLSGVNGATRVFVPTRLAAGSQTYSDPTGDAVNDAPDISSIVVANDDAGVITVAVSLANRSDVKDNDGVFVVMDTDQNASTGSGGFDYIYLGIKDRNALFGWGGSSFGQANAPSLHGTNGNGQVTFSINRADLGNTTGFNFYVES